jgi:enoyl-CoA hydratase
MESVSPDYTGAVAVITLNAPERHNALTPGMAGRLVEVCEAIDAEPTAGAAIIQGAGGHFCAVAHRDVLRAAERDPADSASYADNSAVFGAFYASARGARRVRMPSA